MNKEKIKKTLAGLGIAGLIAGVGLMSTGCQSADKKAKGEAETKIDSTATSVDVDSAKSSCGQGSCGQDTTKQDTTAKSSCSK